MRLFFDFASITEFACRIQLTPVIVCEEGRQGTKTRTLENHEDAAPKTILTVSLSATRLGKTTAPSPVVRLALSNGFLELAPPGDY